MTILAAVLAAALTRAEIIDRMRAAPVGAANGLVSVIGDCPKDMRREFQRPIARFADGVCRTLYGGEEPRRFDEPGIVIYIGDVQTNVTDVVVKERVSVTGRRYTQIRLPAPAYADLDRLRIAVARAFLLAVNGESADDAAAVKALRAADPVLRAEDAERELQDWLDGKPVEGDDEKYLRLVRTVQIPGRASPNDVLRYASRLMLYPPLFHAPFCGKYRSCTFREAIDMTSTDPRVRIQAYLKVSDVMAFACGRGDALAAAATAYSDFLRALAVNKSSREELAKMLDDADAKLNAAFEEACGNEKGTRDEE